MLNVMRKHAGSWMIKVILFAIVIVFVFWGVGSFRSQRASKVATVNDQVITVTEYRQAYNNLIEQYRQRFGASLDDNMIEMLQIKRQAIDQLINRALLLQVAENLNLSVSDAEVSNSITSAAVFQNNGVFNARRYRSILAQYHLTPEEFEAEQKQVLLGEKLTRVVTGAAKVSDPEARQWYDWQNTTVDVAYTDFDPATYKDVTVSDEAVAAYYDENKENYKTEPERKARYVVFDPDQFKNQVTVDDAEISDYYENHRDDFNVEKRVNARHILIKVPPGADEATVQAAKKRADEIYRKAKAGEDFAELAKTYSEGPSKDQGGELGSFTRSQMVKPFADKAFSMAPGEISEPILTQFGWHIIKVEGVTPASTKTLEQAKPEIVKVLTERQAGNLAYDKAEQFYDNTFEKNDLVKNAKALKMTVLETGPFTRRGPESLGRDRAAFAETAFSLGVDEISEIKDIGGRYYIIQTTETIASVVPPLEAVKEKVVRDLERKKRIDKARESAEAMVAALKAGEAFNASAAKLGVTVKQTGDFKRDGQIPDIGADPAFARAAFELASVGSTSAAPVQVGGKFYLLRLTARKAPTADGFDGEKAGIKAMLLRQKQATVFQQWMESRRAEAEITIASDYQN